MKMRTPLLQTAYVSMKLKKKASSVLKRKKISGINFDGETINLTVKFSWEAFGDGNKGQPVQ